jgi:hypothetical protein
MMGDTATSAAIGASPVMRCFVLMGGSIRRFDVMEPEACRFEVTCPYARGSFMVSKTAMLGGPQNLSALMWETVESMVAELLFEHAGRRWFQWTPAAIQALASNPDIAAEVLNSAGRRKDPDKEKPLLLRQALEAQGVTARMVAEKLGGGG